VYKALTFLRLGFNTRCARAFKLPTCKESGGLHTRCINNCFVLFYSGELVDINADGTTVTY
jgi:hypothetical protein